MRGIRAVCAGAVVALGAREIIGAAAAQNRSATIEVGPNVQVSAANADRHHLEVDLAADPRRPGGLLACSMITPPLPSTQFYRTVAYQSGDGGPSWRPTLEVENGVTGNFDPTCAFGPNGTAYFVAFEANHGAIGRRTIPLEQSLRDYLLMYRSTDGGRNWLKPPQVLPGHGRPWITVDATVGERKGTVYLSSFHAEPRAEGGRVQALRIQTLGSDGVRRSDEALAIFPVEPGAGTILSDGTWVTAFGEGIQGRSDEQTRPRMFGPTRPATYNLIALMSSSGGRSFFTARAGTVTDYRLAYAGEVVSLAADSSDGPFRDRLYLTWSDVRSGRFEILLARSNDRGRTWSLPTVVNDDAPPVTQRQGPDHYMPTVRVNHAGVVGVSWYDRRSSPDNMAYEARFAASLDGGESFLPSVRVSEALNSAVHNVWSLQYSHSFGGGNPVPEQRTTPFLELAGIVDVNQAGHTAGLAVTPEGTFHVLWVDNRTGRSQVWTAPVTVRGAALRHGSTDLEALTDVSQHVMINLVNTNLVRSTGTVMTIAHIVNTSNAVLTPPLKLRAISLRSDLGPLTAMNADNGTTGPGAIWDFSAVVEDGALRPGVRTRGRELVFRIAPRMNGLDGRAIDYQRAVQAFDIGARVFAGSPAPR